MLFLFTLESVEGEDLRPLTKQNEFALIMLARLVTAVMLSKIKVS